MNGSPVLKVRKEVSEAQVQANRLNSRKSTGPRTAEGKARSSQNRLSHGFFSRKVVLEGESQEEFDALRSALIAEHQPRTITQQFLVERISIAMWRLNRMHAIEDQAHHWERQSIQGTCSQRIYEAHRDVASTSLRMLGASGCSVLEKLELYERRLEGTVHRCLRQLSWMKQEENDQSEETKPRAQEQAAEEGNGEQAEQKALQDEVVERVGSVEESLVAGIREAEPMMAPEFPPHPGPLSRGYREQRREGCD